MNTAAPPIRFHRGVTLVETVVSCASAALLIAVLGGATMAMRQQTGEEISKANLAELYQSHVGYAESNSGLQWCAHLDNFGTVGSCYAYLSQVGCPPPQILGWDSSGGQWGFYLVGELCSGYPGASCANWPAYVPNGFQLQNWFGSAQLINVRSFHDYVGGRFYDARFYAPNDTTDYNAAAPYFSNPAEFVYEGTVVLSSYHMSAAAMWSPDVLRPAASGGYQAPPFPTAFTRQALAGAAYPELKSLMFEKNWNQAAPSPGQPYNADPASRPVTLFYDGRVANIANMVAIIDDLRSQAQGGGELWCRSTPAGSGGYMNGVTSHSVLTTSGILGRDVLDTRCGVRGQDVAHLVADWGGTSIDLSHDGTVDGFDLNVLLSCWSNCQE